MEETNQESEVSVSKPRRGRPPVVRTAGIPSAPSGALSVDNTYRSSLKAPDPFLIGHRDPDREYRFISKTMLDKNGGFDRRGWEPITAQNHKGETLETEFGTISSGTDLRYGDTVLGFMSKERMAQKRSILRNTRNLARATLERLKNAARSIGALDYDRSSIQRPGRNEEAL